jgi:hypothetical protein
MEVINAIERELLAYPLDYALITVGVIAGILLILMILTIVNLVKISKLKKKYNKFMEGSDAKTLEENISGHLNEIDGLITSNAENKEHINQLTNQIQFAFQKYGLVKYDAFQEMGGKLSFSLCILNEKMDGFIINAMHTREGCYTYIKEIIAGNSVILLSDEEKQALDMAKAYK